MLIRQEGRQRGRGTPRVQPPSTGDRRHRDGHQAEIPSLVSVDPIAEYSVERSPARPLLRRPVGLAGCDKSLPGIMRA